MRLISLHPHYLLKLFLHGLLYAGILLKSQVQSDGQSYGGALLKIEWDYNNPESQLENGQVCDRVGGRECDVYFTLCLKNAASVTSDIDKCHLLQHTTRIYDNAGYLEFRGGDAIEVSLPQPAPNEYTFTLGIFEQDIFGVVEIIGTLVAQQFTLLPTNEWTEIKMDRDNNHYQNKINVNVRMKLSCFEHYYGKHCHVFCKPEPSRYTCSSDGSYICVPGLHGSECDKEDSCYFEPCADHATCVNKENETGRVCICGGEEKPECYSDYNPCQSKPCQNGGECQLGGHYNKSFTCICTEQWTGHRCTERRSACLEEAMKIKLHDNQSTEHGPNNTEVAAVCLNGGTCFEHPLRFEVRCVCLPEWIGARCEIPAEPLPSKTNWLLFTLMSVGIILFIMVLVLTVGIIWKCVRRKRMVDHGAKHGAIVYYHNPRTSSQSNYGSSCPLNPHFMNNTYEDTSNIPPIIVKPSNAAYSKKIEPSPVPDEYDECDPLGLYAGAEIYATAFPPDEVEEDTAEKKNNKMSTPEAIMDPFNECAPPLPVRPSAFNISSYQLLSDSSQSIDRQRPKSPSTVSTFTNNFNDLTSYRSSLRSDQPPNVSVISSSFFDGKQTSNCDA